MPKPAKEVGKNMMPKDLPMPKYEYQKPSSETYSFSFAEDREARRKVIEEDEFSLQNLKLVI